MLPKSNKKNILVLSTNTSDGMIILWCLHEAGYEAFVAGNLSKNIGIKNSLLCKKFFAIPENYNFEKRSQDIIPFLSRIIKEEKIDLIIPSGFESIKFISQYKNVLSEIIGLLPVPSSVSIETLGNKLNFFNFCNKNNIPTPPTYLLENIETVKECKIPINFPVLTKPISLHSGIGVNKFENEKTLYCYLTTNTINKSNSLPILLQEFIPGYDIDFNGFASNGRLNAWTIQRFIEIQRKNTEALRWLEFIENRDVLKIGEEVVKYSNYSGPIHIDLRIGSNDGMIRAIEVNPRFWAGTYKSICDGVNFIDVGIRTAFDNNYLIYPKYSNHIWGTPHRLPFLILKHRNLTFVDYAFRHTFFEIKYLVLNILFNFIAKIKSFYQKILRQI